MSFLLGGQFGPAEGGQFRPAKTGFFKRLFQNIFEILLITETYCSKKRIKIILLKEII